LNVIYDVFQMLQPKGFEMIPISLFPINLILFFICT